MDVDSLILAVFRKPAIWDRRMKEHGNRKVVSRAWKAISEKLKYEEPALKNKWKSLRDYFVTEYNKRPLARSGDVADKHQQSKWQYFNQLLFLKDIIAPRTSFDYLDVEECEGDQSSPFNAFVSSTDIATRGSDEESEKPDILTINTALDSPEPGPSQELSHGPSASKRPKTRAAPPEKRSRDSSGSYRELTDTKERKLQYLGPNRENADQTNDADFLFLQSLHPYLQMVPEHMKLCVRNRLQTVVQEFAYPEYSTTMFTAEYN